MTTTRRGTNSLTDTTGTNHHVPLPTGSVAGDWCIVAAVGNATTPSLGMPGTQLSQGTIGNTLYGVSTKQLDSTDISNGYLNVTTPSSQNVSAVIVGYSVSGGFDAIGTVTIRPSTSTDTTALAVTSDGSQDILVFSLAKTNSATTVSDSPSTTLLANAIQSSGALPSAHVAVYTGTAANRTSTWNVSSGNGCGFQIGVTPAASGSLSNTVAPAVTPTSATTGTVLSTDNGTWNATPDSYTYQWKKAGATISGATASSYTVVSGDLGSAITVVVTAAKSGYTGASATSNGVTPATAKPILNIWDGSAMQQVTVEGVWDGSAIQPVTVEGVWDGTSIKPVAIT